MATNYPGSLDTSSEQPSPLASTELDDAGFEHDVVHTNHSGAIIALETKVGTGSSTAVADSVLAGTGAGTSGWTTTPTVAGLTVAPSSGNASATIMAASGSYPQLFFGDGGTNQWHIESTPSGGALYFVETGVGYPMTFLAGGKVGIGTTTPVAGLDIGTTAGDTWTTNGWDSGLILNAASTLRWREAGGVNYGIGNSGGTLYFMSSTSSTTGAAADYRMVINSSGNVGIGDTAPENALHVYRTGYSPSANDDAALRVEGNWGGGIVMSEGSARTGIYAPGGNQFQVRTGQTSTGGGTIGIHQATTGDVGIRQTTIPSGVHLHVLSQNRAVSIKDSGYNNYAEIAYTSSGTTSPANGLLTGYGLFFKTGTTQAGLADRIYIAADGRVAINGTSLQSGYELTVNGDIYATGGTRSVQHTMNGNSSRDKYRVWNSSLYTIGMQSSVTYGYLNDYAMTFQMNSVNNRGFWWGDSSHSTSGGAMSLTTDGRLCVATRISVGQGQSVTSPNSTYNFYNNGTSWLNGTLSVPGVYNLTTAATTPYVHLSTSTYAYKMYRSTSTLASKRNIEDMEDFYADLMLQSRPVWYQSAIETDDPGWSWLGLVAEEQAALDPHLANWQVREDWDGDEFDHMSEYPQEALEVSGVPYERLSVPLLLLCQRQQNEINDLEARVAALEAA